MHNHPNGRYYNTDSFISINYLGLVHYLFSTGSTRLWLRVHKHTVLIRIIVQPLEFCQVFLMDRMWIQVLEEIRMEPLCYACEACDTTGSERELVTDHEDVSILYGSDLREYHAIKDTVPERNDLGRVVLIISAVHIRLPEDHVRICRYHIFRVYRYISSAAKVSKYIYVLPPPSEARNGHASSGVMASSECHA